MAGDPLAYHLHRVSLDKIRIGTNFRVSKVMLMETEITMQDTIDRAIDVQVRGYLFGRKNKSYEFTAPLTWWDAFKVRWFGEHLLRWYPAKYRTERVDVMEIYPELNIALPEYAHQLVLERRSNDGR